MSFLNTVKGKALRFLSRVKKHVIKKGFGNKNDIRPNQLLAVLLDNENKATRINVVLESVDNASAIIFSIGLANQLSAPLRIITRHECEPATVTDMISQEAIDFPVQLTFHTAPIHLSEAEGFERLFVSTQDVFVATSVWSAALIESINMRQKYLYFSLKAEKMSAPSKRGAVFTDGTLIDQLVSEVIHNAL